MTTLECISILESIVSGFATTQESKWGREKLIEILNQGRSMGISLAMTSGVRIHPTWTQNFIGEWDERLQESDCYSVFKCPSPIQLTKAKDGHIWVGNKDGSKSYSRVNSIGELLNRKNHPAMSLSLKKSAMALWEDGLWKVEREKHGFIQELATRSIFNNPLDVPYFNITVDPYPIDERTFDFVKEYLRKMLTQIEQTPVLTPRTNPEIIDVKR